MLNLAQLFAQRPAPVKGGRLVKGYAMSGSKEAYNVSLASDKLTDIRRAAQERTRLTMLSRRIIRERDMQTIKSISPVLLNGQEWVVRARLSDDTEQFKGVGSGYTKAQAQACASAPGAPRVGQPVTALIDDREPNMSKGVSTEGMPSCWGSLPAGGAVAA